MDVNVDFHVVDGPKEYHVEGKAEILIYHKEIVWEDFLRQAAPDLIGRVNKLYGVTRNVDFVPLQLDEAVEPGIHRNLSNLLHYEEVRKDAGYEPFDRAYPTDSTVDVEKRFMLNFVAILQRQSTKHI